MTLADRFFLDAEAIGVASNDSIHRSYQHFVGFFAALREYTEREVVIGAYFTYGWMPTMLNLRGDLRETVGLLNKVRKEGCRLTHDEMMTIARNVNSSMVGTSKLLHFVRPDVHAIWDSRVYRYLHQKKPYTYRLEAPETYGGYLDQLAELQKDERFGTLKQRLEQEIGYEVSQNRIGEYVMYCCGAPG